MHQIPIKSFVAINLCSFLKHVFISSCIILNLTFTEVILQISTD